MVPSRTPNRRPAPRTAARPPTGPAVAKSLRPAKAVLWDMDGTLVDTEPYWIECEFELVERHGTSWDDDKARMLVGADLRDAARLMQRHGGVRLEVDDIVNRMLDGVVARVQQQVPWRPGARELLAELKAAGVPCALVTMSWRRFAESVVSALPPGSFAAVITGDMVRHGKPHPEPYLTAAATLGLRPEQCVAIEDSPTGVRSAVAAGCRTFAVPNVVDIPPGSGYWVMRSLAELPRSALGLGAPATRSNERARRPPQRWWQVVAGLVAVLGIGAGVAIAVRGDDSPPPYTDVPAAAWAPYWELDAAATSIGQHSSMLQEVSPFWYTANSATDVSLSMNLTADDTTGLLAAARAAGLEVVPTIHDGTDPGRMAAILGSTATRKEHVATIVQLVDDGGYDGIDIDYERFAFDDSRDTWDTTRVAWVKFIEELGAALHARGRTLAVTIPPLYDSNRTAESGAWVYDPASIAQHIDELRVMAYDYSVAEPGPIAPVDWVRTIVVALKRMMPDDTVIRLGIPLYGRNWVLATSGTCPEDAPGRVSPNQHEVAALLADYGVMPVHDPLTAEASFAYDRPTGEGATACVQHRQVHYMDAEGVRARIDVAREERIGGVVLWGLGFDDPATWQSADGALTPLGVDGPR